MTMTRLGSGGLAAVAIAAAAVAGCGSKSKSSSAPAKTKTVAAAPAAGTLAVSETEFKLTPSNPTVKSGTVTIKASNDGTTVHALEVKGPSGEVKSGNISPGQSATLKVKLTKPGKYEFYCPVDGHKNMGMKGEIVVGSGGGGSKPAPSGSSGGGSSSGY